MKTENQLRTGYTTGTTAAAAAGAAAFFLCTGRLPEKAYALLPDGSEAVLPVENGEWLEKKLSSEEEVRFRGVFCMVRKDAGDDPDVTNEAFIRAEVWELAKQPLDERPCYRSEEHPGLWLYGGRGVGMVTKKGLSCPVGYPAINPVPRAMIFAEVDRARKAAGYPQKQLWIEISIPAGEELAARTFNPKLGIVGGISVLGTSGIVHPMSEAALVETIRLEIRVRAAEGKRTLAVAPGNYGEHFLKEAMGLSMDSFVKCSNFIGETFRILCEERIETVLLAGHIGKLIKVAGGVMNTHSKYGDRRMEILMQCAGAVGMTDGEITPLAGMNTTEEAVEYLSEAGWLSEVTGYAAEKIKTVLEERFGIRTEVLLFSSERGLLAKTGGAFAVAAGISPETTDT